MPSVTESAATVRKRSHHRQPRPPDQHHPTRRSCPCERPAHEARGVAGQGLRRVRCRFAGSVESAMCMRGLRCAGAVCEVALVGGDQPGRAGVRVRSRRVRSHPVDTDGAPLGCRASRGHRLRTPGMSRPPRTPTAHPWDVAPPADTDCAPLGCRAPRGHRLRTPGMSRPPRTPTAHPWDVAPPADTDCAPLGCRAPRGHRLRTRGVSRPRDTDCAPRGVSRPCAACGVLLRGALWADSDPTWRT